MSIAVMWAAFLFVLLALQSPNTVVRSNSYRRWSSSVAVGLFLILLLPTALAMVPGPRVVSYWLMFVMAASAFWLSFIGVNVGYMAVGAGLFSQPRRYWRGYAIYPRVMRANTDSVLSVGLTAHIAEFAPSADPSSTRRQRRGEIIIWELNAAEKETLKRPIKVAISGSACRAAPGEKQLAISELERQPTAFVLSAPVPGEYLLLVSFSGNEAVSRGEFTVPISVRAQYRGLPIWLTVVLQIAAVAIALGTAAFNIAHNWSK